MKMLFLFLLVTGLVPRGRAAIPVTDVSVLAQTVEQVRLVTEEMNLIATQVERLGSPATIKPSGVASVIESVNLTGVGKGLSELRFEATGAGAMWDDGDGLYRPIGDLITTADGNSFIRLSDPYRKYDAVTRATVVLEDVMTDTEVRRQNTRAAIQTATAALGSATTVAEVQKLQGVLTAQAAELAAIDRERDAALSRVVVQNIANQADAQKQEQARREERKVDFQTATETLGRFLTPDSRPLLLPDPRSP